MHKHLKDPTCIHETVLKSILDLYDDIKQYKNSDFASSKGPMGRGATSIASASSNYTLVFPVICSRGISVETASMVSKALEKNAVTMLQRLFAAHQVVQAKDKAIDLDSYLGMFHKNISTKNASLNDVFEIMDRFSESEAINKLDIKTIREDMKNIDYRLPDSISETSLNNFYIRNNIIFEGAAANAEKTALDIEYARHRNDNMVGDKAREIEKHNLDVEKNTLDIEYSRFRNNNMAADKRQERLKNDLDAERVKADINKNSTEYFKNQVITSEYKKANELMPTMMTVNFRVETDKSNVIDFKSALVGVKAKLYPIGSEDIIKHIVDKTNSRNWITNFFRASTRETSFLKDFLFAIDKAKIDALSFSERNGTSDKMWKVLERRATLSRLKRSMRQNNDVGAITTLCVSQEEVEYLRKYESIDLEKVSVINGLFASYNLMCVCIVDESLEVAKFIYDEADPMWETISFTHLEREAADNSYKKVVNLMTKMQR